MVFPKGQRYYSGMSIPLFALRTSESTGCGDFLDLKAMGRFAKSCGFDLVQLLPVNDTGMNSSPYSNVSSMALNPIYLRLNRVSYGRDVPDLIAELREKLETPGRGKYREVYAGKLSVLKAIYRRNLHALLSDDTISTWVASNGWVQTYAVYSFLKEQNNAAPWTDWKAYGDPDATFIATFWIQHKSEVFFYAWVQYECEMQLSEAAVTLKDMGVNLKGDLPILMCEDSADVWASRSLFNLKKRAGAPPDQFSELGQNWGFPVYDWDGHREAVLSFWKNRIQKAATFYAAYRIDHVLGFFRIWSIDVRNMTGSLGVFSPSIGLSRKDLQDAGFDDARIAWLSEPHIPLHEIQSCTADPPDEIIRSAFVRIGSEDLFKFSPAIRGERDIEDLLLSKETREALLAFYRDRSLYEAEPGMFYPFFSYKGTKAYRSLDDRERSVFDGLIAKINSSSEAMWEKRGKAILKELQAASDMLVCAEDLGAVPDCVPKTLEELGILGLKINRWTKRWKEEGKPYIPVSEYPYRTVTAPSVHDTSTLASYWEEEADDSERRAFLASIGVTGVETGPYSDATATTLIRGILSTHSMICIFQIQDVAGLSQNQELASFSRERINVPGTVNDTNWTLRLPMTIDRLEADEKLIRTIRSLTDTRRKRT